MKTTSYLHVYRIFDTETNQYFLSDGTLTGENKRGNYWFSLNQLKIALHSPVFRNIIKQNSKQYVIKKYNATVIVDTDVKQTIPMEKIANSL